MTGSGAPVGSELGKEILMYATNQDYCVLEFKQNDDGMRVAVITDHVRELERQVEDNA